MNRLFFISLLLLGGLVVSCQDDILLTEKVPPIEVTDIDALRSIKPTSTSGRSGGAIHDGEKGRDRRDNVDYYGNEGLKIESSTELHVGDIYVAGYDEEKDEYLLKFYWGEEISEETKTMLSLAKITMHFVRKGYNNFWYAKGSSSNGMYYSIGDAFFLPKDICCWCTDIEVSICYYSGLSYSLGNVKEWTQSFETLNLKGATK